MLTISDACSRGERDDASGTAIVDWCIVRGDAVSQRGCIPDESGTIVATMVEWSDSGKVDVIISTGGTGLSPRDVTPEATRAVIDREAPGIAEALRAAALPGFPRAALSRGVAGLRGRVLLVNLPGSPGGVRDGVAVLDEILDHAVAIALGDVTEHR
ncbi:MAG: MogA/MoaB family molybdenum cofactor biosynthesis protein [Gemmatimonadales bacterium]